MLGKFAAITKRFDYNQPIISTFDAGKINVTFVYYVQSLMKVQL
jgi:hypothetical protein